MEPELEEKIEKMMTKASRKLEAAQVLYEDGIYDDAISRAYYAMFHAATALLLKKGVTAKTHSGLLTMFSLHYVKSGEIAKEYFDILSESKELRENGDYEPYFEGHDEEARLALANAKKFLKKAEEILGTRRSKRP